MRVFIGIALAIASASALGFTGNQALQLMTGSEQKDFRLAAYAIAFSDQEMVVRMNTQEAAKRGDGYIVPFCKPHEASANQTAAIIRNELKNSPENNHLDLAVIARTALVRVWPCSQLQLIDLSQ